MTDYTEREVRGTIAGMQCCIDNLGINKKVDQEQYDWMRNSIGKWKRMLTQLADMLADREKAEPGAWRITDGEGDYNYRTSPPSDTSVQWAAQYNRRHEPLYTHPAAQPRVQDGYVMVPIKPTEEMLAALDDAQAKWLNCESDTEEFAIRAWEAMVLAAQPYATFTLDDMRSMQERIKAAGEPIDLSFYNTRPAAQPRVQDDVSKVIVDREGVRFGKYFWASHEAITGNTAESLRLRTGIGAGYMRWLDAMLAAQEGRSRE